MRRHVGNQAWWWLR